MRILRYNAAASLDGYIAGPKGEVDWIPMDSSVDFASIFAKVDTVLLGRRSYESVLQCGDRPWKAGTRVYVFSGTLHPEEHPEVKLISEDAGAVVSGLRAEEGDGELWLFGGGELFRSLLKERQVDRLEITVVPVLLGGGVPLLPPEAPLTQLKLIGTRTYPSGMVTLSYAVQWPSNS